MHGYDIRFLFKKIILPSPITILEFIVILATACFTLNYVNIGLSIVYFLISYRWDLYGYKLTKPKVPDYIVIRENEDL